MLDPVIDSVVPKQVARDATVGPSVDCDPIGRFGDTECQPQPFAQGGHSRAARVNQRPVNVEQTNVHELHFG